MRPRRPGDECFAWVAGLPAAVVLLEPCHGGWLVLTNGERVQIKVVNLRREAPLAIRRGDEWLGVEWGAVENARPFYKPWEAKMALRKCKQAGARLAPMVQFKGKRL